MHLYTVGILQPDGLGVLVRHVRGDKPLSAYFQALKECDEEVPADEPGQVTVPELMRDWPLLFVLEGHVPFLPVLTGSDLS